MELDIRFPVGMIFSALGLILLIYGAATNHDVMYAVSMDININMIWGVAMLVFGVATLGLARKRARTVASIVIVFLTLLVSSRPDATMSRCTQPAFNNRALPLNHAPSPDAREYLEIATLTHADSLRRYRGSHHRSSR